MNIGHLHQMKARSVSFLHARCTTLPATVIPGTLALEIVDFGDGRPWSDVHDPSFKKTLTC